MTKTTGDTADLVNRGGAGDEQALKDLFSRHRDRLRRMILMRLDRRLRRRLDDSDVLQDVYMEASRRLRHYVDNPGVPFFVWLRSLTGERIAQLHRHHLGVQARDARREVPIEYRPLPAATTAVIAAHLLGTMTSPSEELARAELELKIREGLEELDPLDREVLVLRHFERLTNAETAQELGIRESTASKRYTRALLKLRAILEAMPGGLSCLTNGETN